MKKTLVLVLPLLFVLKSVGQNYKIVDSLKYLIDHERTQDTNTVNRNLLLARQYVFSFPDTAISYLRKAILLSQQLHFAEGLFNSSLFLSYPLAVARADSAAVSSAFSAL